MQEQLEFRGKDTYAVQSKTSDTGWYTAYLVQARASGQYFTLITTGEQLTSDHRGTLQRAARIMSTVESPHIIKAHDIDVLDSNLFMVLDQMEGQPLSEWMQTHQQLDEFTALRLFRQLALALKDLEYYRCIHGNIRHSSIMVSPDSSSKGEMLLKIWDLVLSTRLEDTIAFQAPEKIRENPLDIRTDIYSIGAVMYWMMTGKPPYETHNTAKLALLISGSTQGGEQAALSGRRTDLTSDCVALVDRCLQRHPRDRFQTASDLVAAVEDVLGRQRDSAGFMMHQAKVAAQRDEWREVLRLYERAQAIRGPKKEFRLLVQRAEKMLEEEGLAQYGKTMRDIDELRRDRQLDEAEEAAVALKGTVTNHRFLRSKQRAEMLRELAELEETMRLERRFQPALLASNATEQEYALQTPLVTVMRSAADQGERLDTVNLWAEPNHATVSRRSQATLRFADGAWHLQHDTEAVNSTRINGEKVSTEVIVEDEDVLCFGQVEVIFRLRQAV